MKIDKSKVEVSFTFSPETHFLVHAKDDRFGDNGGSLFMVWSLSPRIDRSDKGKDDDVGIPELYLSDEEAETLKSTGFSAVEYPL